MRIKIVRFLWGLLFVLLGTLGCNAAAREGASISPNSESKAAAEREVFEYQNPLMFEYEALGEVRRELRDPCIIREGDTYYLVFTVWPFSNREENRLNQPNQGGSPGIKLYSSKDMKTWKFENWLVKSDELPEDCPYKNRFWAPEIHKMGGRFYMIFTADNWIKKEYNPAGTWGTAGYAFVGVADKITGPYENITYIDGGACDTSLFEDVDGKTYAIIPAYNVYIQQIDLSRIDQGQVKLVGPRKLAVQCKNDDIGLKAEADYQEGPWMFREKDRYFLLYAGPYREAKNTPEQQGYWVGAAYADNVMGPWEKDPRGQIFYGGHIAVFEGPDNRPWFSYRWEMHNLHRGLLCVDPITIDAEGRMQTNGPTDTPQQVESPLSDGITLEQSGVSKKKNTFLPYSNPVWTGYCADPHVIKYKDMYYAYGTHSEHKETAGIEIPDMKGKKFVLLRSKQLIDWECLGGALEPYKGGENVEYWAPEVAYAKGKFWMYYSAALPGGAGWYQRLRVAVADCPEGPFRDCDTLLFPEEGFTIDADPFQDPKDGKWYLYFSKDTLAGRAGTGIWGVRLDDDMMTPIGKPVPVVLPSADWQISIRNHTIYDQKFDAWHTVEGAHVVYKDGKYYCFYSGGAWTKESYGVAFAVADHPLGPWNDAGTARGACVLKAVPGVFGPGHHSIVMAPDDKTYICAYHAWDDQHVARQLCIDPIKWTENGPHVTPTRQNGRLPTRSEN